MENVRVIKYRYTGYGYVQDMDPAPIFVPKVHLKAVMMKHVLQTQRREQLNSFDLNYPALILGSKVRQEQRPNRDPWLQRPTRLPLHRSARSTKQLQPGPNELYQTWSFLIRKALNLPLLCLKKKKKNRNKEPHLQIKLRKCAWKQSHLIGFRSASVDLKSLFLHFVCLEGICDVTELQPSKSGTVSARGLGGSTQLLPFDKGDGTAFSSAQKGALWTRRCRI